MAPRPPRRFPPGFNPARVRHAAGLLLVLPRHDEAHVVLTERAHTLDRHRGQISLPGGVIEPGESYEDAAAREAQEEIGLDPADIRTIGRLTPLDIPVSGFRLHPVVAVCEHEPPFQRAHDEVARVLVVPIDELMRGDQIVWRTLTRDGATIDFPAFPIEDVEIWGATAMVLAEFLAILGWEGPAVKRD
jgi:8-oxo-dGTP pyrophosphatase MutT (NUDIX family)